MAKQKSSGWLDKFISKAPETFGKGVAASDKPVNRVLPTNPTKLKVITQAEKDAQETKEIKDRINIANAAQSQMWSSPENFATATSAIGDKLRFSENPNIFDDYINPGTFFGHMASGLGQVPLNIKEGNYGQAALNVATPVVAGAAETLLAPIVGKITSAGTKAIGKGLKAGKTAIDQNLTQVGKQLANIEKEGIAKGLSPHEIKMQQMDQVGITSAQREAYVPGVSDLLYKYVRPQGYTGSGGESKLAETLNLIRKGGVEYSKHSNFEDYMTLEDLNKSTILPPREDAWRLYLGKPQKHGTFEMSQTAPIQHPSYTPEQLKNLDLYSIKSSFGKRHLFPGYSEAHGNFDLVDKSSFDNAVRYLENPINVDKQNIIMGGHNKRLSKAGLEYNDIWDLNPTVAPINFLPSNLKPKFADNPFFVNKDSRGVESLREIGIPIDKFIGKPFMTHGVEQKLTSDKVVNDMRKSFVNEIIQADINKATKLDKMKSMGMNVPDMINDINKVYSLKLKGANESLKQLANYPKFEEGGWLDKYDDGGPIQPNYNDASVSYPPNFVGEGTFNGPNFKNPAWGGQFQDGGFLQPNSYKLPKGIKVPYADSSSELAMSIGGEDGEPAYLIPSFKYGQPLKNPMAEYMLTGEHLGGPFKTWQEADKWEQDIRHPYVEKGQAIPTPIKTWGDMAMGGSMPGAVGFTYARTNSPAPSNGPYAKKTKASAQDGKTVYSGMLPEITVVGSKDPQTEEFYRNMMDRLTKEEGYANGISSDDPMYNNPKDVDMVYNYPIATDHILGRYEGLMDLGKKYGFPKVHPVDKNSLLSKMATTVGGDRRPPANYDASSKTIQADSTEDWVSEMAHHIQMKDNRFNKTMQWMKNDLPALAISQIMLGNRFGQYHVPGTVEHEAHSVIEPKLLEEMKKSENKYKQLPYRQKKMEEFYGPIESYQNGGEMKYYQEGLDFKPKSISKNGSVIKDDMGQWNHPGEITEIGSNQITMQGVPYPVMGISDTGDTQMMYPNEDYTYEGSSVTEYPMMQDGGVLDSVIGVGKGVVNYVDNLVRTGINKLSALDDPAPKTINPYRDKQNVPPHKPDMYDAYQLSGNYAAKQWTDFNKQFEAGNVDTYKDDKNRVKLNTGRFTGANVPASMIDDLAKSAKKNGIPLGQMLALVGRESTFGQQKSNMRSGAKNEYTSGWNVAEEYRPYDADRFLADQKVPGIETVKTSSGWGYDVTDEKAARAYVNAHPELLQQYKAKLAKTPNIGDQNSFDLSARYLKKKGIQGYNPGDPTYVGMFQKDYNTLKTDKNLMAYLKKKGYRYEDGGELTKLDQLTNFTNYNTKQPGGWLDKYQD